MGHLGNPIAFRLGFEKKWKFLFFVKQIYYPEFINNIINVRDYIYYYFTRKNILKSGICFSHLFISKLLKFLYIDIYIYHIELERSSYELINEFFSLYYDLYNELNTKYFKIKNKTQKQWRFINTVRQQTNSDLFVFYFTYIVFFNNKWKKPEINNLNKNRLLINNDIRYYSKFILFNYLKKLLWKFRNESILFKTFESIVNARKYNLRINKNKRLRKRRLYFKNLRYLKNIIRKIGNANIKRKYRLKLKNITSRQEKYLELYTNRAVSLERKKSFLSIFFKNNVLKIFKKMTSRKLRNFNLRSIAALNDSIFRENFNSSLLNKSQKKYSILSLLFYLAKKVQFKKYDNSRTLWIKWLKIYKYLYIFNRLKILSLKKSKIYNINNFFFFFNTFIYLSKKAYFQAGSYFNFRQGIYGTIYYGIFNMFFYKYFKMFSNFLKKNIQIIFPKLKKNNIYFTYFFIANNNVSSQLISRYIALKLKKGFILRKIVNPLKWELIRVATRHRKKQKPFIIYNYKKMLKNKILFYNNNIKNYFKLSYFIFFIKLISFYKQSGILIYYHMHKWNRIHKIIRKKKNVDNLIWFYFDSILNNMKIKLLNKFKLRKKYFFKRKKLYINTLYILLFNYNRKSGINNYYKNNININLHFLNNLFLNNYKLIQCTLFYSYKIIKKINNKFISISAFFNKNISNFHILKTMWLAFKKINVRNVRHQYIPLYYSNIMGFKMVFKGRFSRKERASKMRLQIGKIPLNILNVNIDYNFITLPIKNSAISIKVYLYRMPIVQLYKNIVKL